MMKTHRHIYAAAAMLLVVMLAACEQPQTDDTDVSATPRADHDTSGALTDAERQAGWVSLLNSDGLDQWTGFQSEDIPAKWVVDDGALHFDPDAQGAGGDIVTKESYADFEFAFEWKISECGNSGVIYRADVSANYQAPWNTGPEFQILDNSCHPDAREGQDRHAGANYDMQAPTQDVTVAAGGWNEARIVVDSAHVEHWLNGTKVVEYELGSDEWEAQKAESKWVDYPDYGTPREGRIALQDHDNPVWYRNLRIRRL